MPTTPPRGRGRPKKSADTRARCRTYRLTDAEAAQLAALAQRHALSDSRMLAQLITTAAASVCPPA